MNNDFSDDYTWGSILKILKSHGVQDFASISYFYL